MKTASKFALVAGLILSLACAGFAQVRTSFGNIRSAFDYAYGIQPASQSLKVISGSSGTGSYSITLAYGYTILSDGTKIYPVSVTAPIKIGAGTSQETVTPSSVSCSTLEQYGTCSITATFTYSHGSGDLVRSGSYGVQEAVNAAFGDGGGQVAITPAFYMAGGTVATINAVVGYPSVVIVDSVGGSPTYWNLSPSTTTLLAAPTVLTGQAACDSTHQFCSDGTVAGSASWGGTVIGCYTLVDINGNESPCSATNSFTSVASKAINMGISQTARTDNVVGWKPYLSLSGGSYALAYSLPLLTQPTTLLAVPVSAGVCTLTTLESATPACAIDNSKYGQTGSRTGSSATFLGGAQFTGYPVVTNTLAPEIGSVSALQHNPNFESHATYAYIPGMHVGVPGLQGLHIIFPVTAAAQTGIGEVVGSIPLPANFMNYVGRTIEVCGLISKTSTVADTVDDIQIWWDAEGSNVTAGTPVQVSSIKLTSTGTAAFTTNFCQQITTTVASTSATGGSLLPGQGWLTKSQVAAGTVPVAASASLVAAVGSLNLALPAHLTIELVHTTGTDGAGATLLGATVRVVN